jgi:hypothetical protein
MPRSTTTPPKRAAPRKRKAATKPPRADTAAPTSKQTPAKTPRATRAASDKAKAGKHPAVAAPRSAEQALQTTTRQLQTTPEQAPGAVASQPVALILRAMDWAYETANQAVLGFDSAADMATKYRARSQSADGAIDSLIRWHVAYAGAVGFLANVGGALTLPVAIPADLASVLLLQLRMVAAIAHIRGYETTDSHVRTLAFICLAGTSGTEFLTEFSVKLGTALSQRVTAATLNRINQAVGFRLVSKAGASGLVNLSRWVPLLGGIVGGGLDASLTRGIGGMAKKLFKPIEEAAHAPSAARG